MKCIRCRDYSKALRTCKVNKMNPEGREQAIEIATYAGSNKLCRYNKWRDTARTVITLKLSNEQGNVEP